MKIIDKINFIRRDIASNKVKTIVCLIEIVLFSIVIFFLSMGIVTYKVNSRTILNKSYSTLNYDDKCLDVSFSIKKEEKPSIELNQNFTVLSKLLFDNKEKIEKISYNDSHKVYITESFSFFNLDLSLIEGNLDEFEIESVLVSDVYVKKYNETFKTDLKVGDYINYEYNSLPFVGIVCGIYENTSFQSEIIVDFNSIIQKAPLEELKVFVEVKEADNLNQTYKRYNELIKKVNKSINKGFDSYKIEVKKSEFYYDFNQLNQLNDLLNIVLIFVLIAIFAISSVSIVNIIKITIEENENIISIYKAYGIEKKDFLFIYLVELFFLVTIGMIIASVITLIFKSLIIDIVDKILKIVYPNKISYVNFSAKLIFPPYIIVILIIVFYFIIMAFYLKKLVYLYNKKSVTVVE